MDRVLITGAAGFTAAYLIRLLRKSYGDQIAIHGIESNPVAPVHGVVWHQCQLSDSAEVGAALSEICPTHIFHLCGTFSNKYDIDYPANVETTRNLLQELVDAGGTGCRVLLVGSAAEYGRVEMEK